MTTTRTTYRSRSSISLSSNFRRLITGIRAARHSPASGKSCAGIESWLEDVRAASAFDPDAGAGEAW